MANALYDKGRNRFLTGDIDWTGDTIKAVLCTAGYSANLTTDEFLATIVAGNRVATAALANMSAAAGVADADDTTFTSVSGSAATAIVIYQDTGDEATSPLIARIDTATGLPVTPNGSDITIVWDSGANKIFKL